MNADFNTVGLMVVAADMVRRMNRNRYGEPERVVQPRRRRSLRVPAGNILIAVGLWIRGATNARPRPV